MLLVQIAALRVNLSANQIAGFAKVNDLMNEAWDESNFLYAEKRQAFALVQLCFTYFNKMSSSQ